MREFYETVCARCGDTIHFNKPDEHGKYGRQCPECEENLCWKCADWVETGADLICRACKNEHDLPKGTHVPYYQYLHSFDEAWSLNVADTKDKLTQAQWRSLSLAEQNTILAEWDNNEIITSAWKQLTKVCRSSRTRKNEVSG